MPLWLNPTEDVPELPDTALPSKAEPSQAAEQSHNAWEYVTSEVSRVLTLAWPQAGAGVLNFSSNIIAAAFVGQLGRLSLSSWSLAHTFINVTGLSLVHGVVSGLETFCGQAHGARRHAFLGLVLQRALLIMTCLATACVAVWSQAEYILVKLGQDPQIAKAAARYTILYSPALVLFGVEAALHVYLTAQTIVLPSLSIAAANAVLTLFYNWLFIARLGWGLEGAALAVDAQAASKVALYVCYLAVLQYIQAPERRTWHGWSWSACTGWQNYLAIAVPSACAIMLDWWGYEVAIFASGYLPNPTVSLSVTGVCFNMHAWCFMVANGLSTAASTRVSNELGANRPAAAKLATEVSTALGGMWMSLAAAVLVAARHSWPRVFTSDPQVLAAMAVVALPLAGSLLGDGPSTVLAGVLRGAGRQKLGVAVNLGSIWLFGLPLQMVLAFWAGLGVLGLWLGQLVTSVVQAVAVLACVARFDWCREAARAQRMLHEAHGHGPVAALQPEL